MCVGLTQLPFDFCLSLLPGAADANVTCLSCDSVYDFALDLVLHLGLTLSQENGTRCLEEDEDEMIGGSDAQHTDPSKGTNVL